MDGRVDGWGEWPHGGAFFIYARIVNSVMSTLHVTTRQKCVCIKTLKTVLSSFNTSGQPKEKIWSQMGQALLQKYHMIAEFPRAPFRIHDQKGSTIA
eukprot:6429645-Karenia_brevis.AAC.1